MAFGLSGSLSACFNVYLQYCVFSLVANKDACLLAYSDECRGISVPVAFSSMKLTDTQQRWSTIEREAYAALMALKKYRSWLSE